MRCRIRQISILLFVFVVGVRALVPEGHALCLKACGDIALTLADGPHSCKHDHGTRECAERDVQSGHDHQAQSPVACNSPAGPIHPFCTDLDAGDPVVGRGRSPDCSLTSVDTSLGSPPLLPKALAPDARSSLQRASIPRSRGPSPDTYALPLRV